MDFTHCSFAYPGTYGHECGAPAVMVGVKFGAGTKNGVYYARRCQKCASIKGGENSGIAKWESYNKESHKNQWR